jgi:hypothetical protein
VAARARVSINYAGIGRLAKSEQMRRDIQRRTDRVADRVRAAVGSDEARWIVSSAVVGRRRIHGSVMWIGGLRQELDRRILGAAMGRTA